ncbi:MAG: hypothetical protein HUJ30_08245 [Gammaproteobacteria bacterium]|nr:hypothetical protein [Gammaproteobacteria bacterium]
MPEEQFDSRYFRGQGKLFIGDRDANGNAVGLQFIGDIGSAELTPNIERGETIENVSGSNAVGASFLKRAQFNISIAMRSIKAKHLAIALHAADSAKTASSVTDEAHTAKLERMSALEHTNVSTVVVTGSGGTPTYVENTDYKVHAAEGMIEWLSGGTITEDTATLIDYSYAAQTHIKVEPHNLEKFLVFAGKNTSDNDKQTRVELYKVKLDPSVASLITDDTVEMPLNGTVMLDTMRAASDQLYSWKTED